MTYDDIRRRVSAFLYEKWLPAAGLSEEMLRGFLEHGIPEEWAKVIASVIPVLPVSDWPKLIPSPKALNHGKGQRSMLRSKMELENADTKSKRVKIAAAMTKNETEARAAVMEANATPKTIADERGASRASVQAWIDGTRSIPRAHREALAKANKETGRKAISARVWLKKAD